ncbi:hypothetical protein DL96DRAFT_1572815 [Flagelloscypha sp. PMI_526]|nr:hypothetical protein DL96DRAFT_1572815 [Flagelloscypha sp. PMI_526]
MHDPGYRHPFLVGSSFLGGVGGLVDLALSKLSAEIRSSEYDWFSRFRDPDFREMWTTYALKRDWSVTSGEQRHNVRLTSSQVAYALDELEGYAHLQDPNNNCQVSCFERIWEANNILASNSLTELRHEFDGLGQTRNSILVDPYPGCLRYGKTFVPSHLDHSIPSPLPSPQYAAFSTQFAMLPSEVELLSSSRTEPTVIFASYISGLHPFRKRLYNLLGILLSRLIPSFDHVLTDLHRTNTLTRRIEGRPSYTEWNEPDEPEHSDDEAAWDAYRSRIDEWAWKRPVQLPDVPSTGYPGGLEARNAKINLRQTSSKLNVIVRVQKIDLTPQQPRYSGDPLHFKVEGLKNERSCSYDCIKQTPKENLTCTRITFRMAITYPSGYQRGDVGVTFRTWGLKHESPCNQELGSTTLRVGHAVTFPNIYQYMLEPFELANNQKPGYLVLVCFLLIDPDLPQEDIPSTATVPPHQASWVRDALDANIRDRLPPELIDQHNGIFNDSECLELAKEMESERLLYSQASTLAYFGVKFDP